MVRGFRNAAIIVGAVVAAGAAQYARPLPPPTLAWSQGPEVPETTDGDVIEPFDDITDLPVPGVMQIGHKANCGPAAGAMVLGAYRSITDEARLATLRDKLGSWSWDQFPLRRLALPGNDPGMTTPGMLEGTLNHFAASVTFRRAPTHRWIPDEAFAVLSLQRHLAERRPVIVLAQTSTLWGMNTPGLHWIVVRGMEDGRVTYNDPAHGKRTALTASRFWRAWRLDRFYRGLPTVESFTALVPDRGLPPQIAQTMRSMLRASTASTG